MSGDRREAVAPVAKALGISVAMSGLKPAEKVAAIEQMKAHGHCVLMIGDGINDAPALASADVSLSPISAAHITQADADAVFLGERLQPVTYAVDIARRASFL
jgi:Cu2+-exporting ATPase